MEIIKPIIKPTIEPKKMWFRRLGLWTTGISSYYIFTWLYDYVVISALLLYFGIFKGSIIAIVASMLVDFFTLKFYDWLKKDWLALETVKEFNDKKGFIGKLFRFVHNKGSVYQPLSASDSNYSLTGYQENWNILCESINSKKSYLKDLKNSIYIFDIFSVILKDLNFSKKPSLLEHNTSKLKLMK